MKSEFNNKNNSLLFFTFVWIDTSIGVIVLNFKNSFFNSKKYKIFFIWKFKIFLFLKFKFIFFKLGKIKIKIFSKKIKIFFFRKVILQPIIEFFLFLKKYHFFLI